MHFHAWLVLTTCSWHKGPFIFLATGLGSVALHHLKINFAWLRQRLVSLSLKKTTVHINLLALECFFFLVIWVMSRNAKTCPWLSSTSFPGSLFFASLEKRDPGNGWVFMWRNHIPKLNITLSSEVLASSGKRPYRNLTFHSVLARQGFFYF